MRKFVPYIIIFVVLYAWQFRPKSDQEKLSDAKQQELMQDVHFEVQDIGSDLDKAAQDAHRIEEERHPGGY